MKQKLLFAALLSAVFLCGHSYAQVTIHNWNFNVGNPTSPDQWPATIAATTGSGSLVHIFTNATSFTGSTVNAEPGDVSGGSFVPVDQANNANYFTLSIPTTGYVSISLSYVTRRTSTGFASQEIQYSLNGTTFVTDTIMTGINATAFEATARVADFSDIPGANNNPNFKVRIIVDGASSGTGNNRFDNVKIQGFLPSVNDGDGSATALNNAGTFSGSTIFTRNTGSQAVLVSVTGVPGGPLDSVRLTLPAGWSGLSAPNVTLGGAFTSLTPTVSSTQITIAGASLGTTAGTIAISGLTSNNPVGALNSGNSQWVVATAKTGGVLTSIASSPNTHTIIPIENIRTGGTDGFGNSDAGGLTSAMNGQVVAVQGVATVVNQIVSSSATQTSFFIQQGGYGLQVFRAAAPSVTWVRGDDLVIKGTIETFDGSTEVVPQTGSSPNFYNLGSGVLPSPLVLPNANAISEAHEGKLVRVNSVTWDSAGLAFSSTVGARNSFRTAPTDTGTLFLSATNPIVGSTIPASGDIIGIIYHRAAIAGPVVPPYKLVARNLVDLGFDPADGTGTAVITPLGRIANQPAVAETLTVTGNGVNTIDGVSVTIPSSWTWDGSSRVLEGAGFSSATSGVTGNGTGGDPWVITINTATVTNVNTGIIRINNLGTPSTTGATTFTTKTRGASGSLANVASQPSVNIGSAFEAVASGNWSSTATWAGGAVPTSSDDVTFSTLGVAVTVDIAGAVCNNLTMLGSGTASNSGPVLQFLASGPSGLTVNGNLSISGGSGGGGGDRGGRPKLTSNGNTAASLTVKKNVTSTSSNTTANGDAGMNMNEGTINLTGATSDTLRFGAGMRLGNLVIGDGALTKTMRTAMSTGATATIRSLLVKAGSTFWIGPATTTNTLTLGNVSTSGFPLLTGGVTVETGAALKVQESTAGFVASTVNIDGGGITNNGTIDLLSPSFGTEALTGCVAHVRFGGLNGGSGSTAQSVGGTGVGDFANVTIDSAHTVTLNQDMNIVTGYAMTITRGTLAETAGNTVIGEVRATRTVAIATPETFGGIGFEMNAAGGAPGSTLVIRTTGTAQTGGSSQSIKRYFDVSPSNNSGLNASMTFRYDDSELNGQNAATLTLYKSTNNGVSWTGQGGTVNTGLRKIDLSGVNSFSRWTAADASNPMGGFSVNVPIGTGWNMISRPVANPVPGDSVRQLYPTASFPYAFAFNPASGYNQQQVMQRGVGYWEKFPGATSQAISGDPILVDSISVLPGWNMIGSISSPVDTSTITTAPPGIKASAFFGFNAGYTAAATIQPGAAYWMKANATGKVILSSSLSRPDASTSVNVLEGFSSITIADAAGNSQTLYLGEDLRGTFPVSYYEMPPRGPEGAFDARFASQRMVETFAKAGSFPIALHSARYPLTVSWDLKGSADRKFRLTDGQQDRAVSGTGSLVLSNPASGTIVLSTLTAEVPTTFSLGQNYPNPFNPATTIRFGLPVQARVTLKVFNLLGQQVAEVVNDVMTEGYHDVLWSGKTGAGAQVGSGVYFYKIEASSVADGKTFSDVRKMVLMK